MGFKLIRIDCEEPAKIPLKVGTHVIGRGSFLNCDDHRVSRQHGVINVTESGVLLKSLHQNPCFFNKRELKKSALLPKGKSIQLSNSDHFGLLPDTYWYEIIFCSENQSDPSQVNEDSIDTETSVDIQNKERELNEETRVFTCYDNSGTQKVTYDEECDDGSDSELLNLQFDETMKSDKSELRSLLTNSNPNAAEDINSSQTNNQFPEHTYCETPGKRSQKPDPNNQAKKARTGLRSQSSVEVGQIDSSFVPTNNDEDSQTFTTQDSHEATNPNETESNIDTDPLRLSREVKKELEPVTVKIEPFSPKKEKEPIVKPGTSNDQAGSSNDGNGTPKPPPSQPVRERCIYGASCYSEPASTRRRVSFTQLDELWEYLNKNRELATGFNKSAQARYECRMLWEKIAARLNSQGDGAKKDWKGWCKYWVDYKCKLKKMALRASQGEGYKILTDIERKFISILGNDVGSGLDGGARVETLELTADDTIPLASLVDTSMSPRRSISPHSPPSSPHSFTTSPLPSTSVTPHPISTSPVIPPLTQPPTSHEPQSSTPPRESPRRRRRRRNSSVSAEAARRALIRETQSRNEIERHRNEIMQGMLRELREIKQILRSNGLARDAQ